MVKSQGLTVADHRLGIGEVARRAGVSVDTVRFYERRGILHAPERTNSGYRKFAPSAVNRILLARQLSHLGMTLEEIAAAARASEHASDCSSELWRLKLVRDRIDAKITELQATRGRLDEVIATCQDCNCTIQAPNG
jgi:DNA-binding transcriptional MerR regulator